MFEFIASVDAIASQVLPPLARAATWGSIAGALSMAVYAWVSPQKRILAIKEEQKIARRALMQHDGEFDDMLKLMRADLGLSLKTLGIAIPAFLISVIPVAFLIYALSPLYTTALVDFGPSWTQGFEFWYIVAMIVISLAVKILFRIA